MAREQGGSVDDEADFLDFAAARQGRAVRAATLVTGDEESGRRLALAALREVAADWSGAREDGPDRRLRRALARSAVATARDAPAVTAGPTAAATPPRPVLPDTTGSDAPSRETEEEEDREAVRAALASLTPNARAVAVLRWLEDRADPETAELLGVDLETVLDDVGAVRRALASSLRREDPLTDDDGTRSLLSLVADEVPETDLAHEAWDGARDRRRRLRRRTALAGGAVVLGGAAAAVLLRGHDDGTSRPRPSPTPTAERLPTVTVAGADVVLAPDPVTFSRLVPYPDAAGLALPERLGPGSERPLEIVSPAGTPAPVRAVYLLRERPDRFRPSLFLPRLSTEAVAVAVAPLRATDATTITGAIGLGPRTIDSGRHRVVVPQPGAVVLLEVRSTRTERFPVPDQGLMWAGWAPDDRHVVAKGVEGTWRVDTRTGKVTQAQVRAHGGWADLEVVGITTVVQRFGPDGRQTGQDHLPGPGLDVYGASASDVDGWVCRGTFVVQVEATGRRMQGLAAARAGDPDHLYLLLASTAPGTPLMAFRPMAWGPGATVLFEARSIDEVHTAVHLLAWDVRGGRVYRVARVDPPALRTTSFGFTGDWAI